ATLVFGGRTRATARSANAILSNVSVELSASSSARSTCSASISIRGMTTNLPPLPQALRGETSRRAVAPSHRCEHERIDDEASVPSSCLGLSCDFPVVVDGLFPFLRGPRRSIGWGALAPPVGWGQEGGALMNARTLHAALYVAAGLIVIACGSKTPPPKEPEHVETVSDAGAEETEAEPPQPKSLY